LYLVIVCVFVFCLLSCLVVVFVLWLYLSCGCLVLSCGCLVLSGLVWSCLVLVCVTVFVIAFVVVLVIVLIVVLWRDVLAYVASSRGYLVSHLTRVLFFSFFFCLALFLFLCLVVMLLSLFLTLPSCLAFCIQCTPKSVWAGSTIREPKDSVTGKKGQKTQGPLEGYLSALGYVQNEVFKF
jgi:hypothetical protein